MLTLNEVKNAVDQLSPQERELRAYLNEHAAEDTWLRVGTMDIDALLQAAQAIREGFTDEEWETIQHAMNEEYVEPVDDDGYPL